MYNFQDNVILVEIFERRSTELQKIFRCNPRKCNSANSFSGCVHRDRSKCLITLQTGAEDVLLFKRTLIGGFSCVNTCLTFDFQILLPKNYRDKIKLIYSLQNQKKISTKISKMDENNQYGNARTKPLPYSCIKKTSKIPSLLEFNRILDRISDTGKNGHLFIVDIKFHNKNEKRMLFNELYTPSEICSSAHVDY